MQREEIHTVAGCLDAIVLREYGALEEGADLRREITLGARLNEPTQSRHRLRISLVRPFAPPEVAPSCCGLRGA